MKASELSSAALVRAGLRAELQHDTSEGATVDADPSLIARALANLIDNAERHGSGLIQLVVERRPEEVAFIARDKGQGISDDVRSNIFAPFKRSGKSAGLGLGLALVERIASAHGGHAFVEPGAEKGASVGFTVPFAG